MSEEKPEISESRKKVLSKIGEYEKLGGEYFFCDVEDDPPAKILAPHDVDYLYKKFPNKIKNLCARTIEALGGGKIMRAHNTKLIGEENLKDVHTGAIITANHFNRFENLCAKMVCDKMPEKHRFWRVVREGNYSMPGLIGFLLKYCNTLPLSSNHRTMVNLGRAIESALASGDVILIYPEQAMWYNYKKPRNYRIGAFYYAAKNNVPVIPCFTTLSEREGYDKDGYPNIDYTVHIMAPIYPDPALSVHENTDVMLKKNFEMCKNKYEEVYKTKLVYGAEDPEGQGD